jgi:glycosyltransferase involved in cell wall biosynthesis
MRVSLANQLKKERYWPKMLTVVISVKNEEENILACLNSIGHNFADKIIVIDSDSSDQTQNIALTWGAEVLNFKWNGEFPKKRNWYLLNFAVNGEWTLFLDADERLTDAVKQEIGRCFKNDFYVGYWIPYTIYISDKVLKHGYPLKKLALFKNGSGLFERINEKSWSHLDMEIHEHPILAGEVGQLAEKIEHKVNINTASWKEKHLAYAKWEARRVHALKKNGNNFQFTFKQKIKYQLLNSPFVGIIFFMGSTILYLGIFDGLKGISYALAKAKYFTTIRKEIKKLKIEK